MTLDEWVESKPEYKLLRSNLRINVEVYFPEMSKEEQEDFVRVNLVMVRQALNPSKPNFAGYSFTEKELANDSIAEVIEKRSEQLGFFRIPFGRKYKGKMICSIPQEELRNYIKWLKSSAVREGSTVSFQVKLLEQKYKSYYKVEEL